MKKYLLAILSLAVIFGSMVGIALADDGIPPPTPLTGMPFQANTDVPTTIGKIVAEAIKYVGLLAILAMTYGAILMITSYGDDAKVKKSKSLMIYSGIGVIVSISAYTLVDIINNLRL